MDSLHEVIFLCRARGNAHESHDPGELLLGGEVGERGFGGGLLQAAVKDRLG